MAVNAPGVCPLQSTVTLLAEATNEQAKRNIHAAITVQKLLGCGLGISRIVSPGSEGLGLAIVFWVTLGN
jgi:hypothetical protein